MGIIPGAMVDLGERADRREVLRGGAQDVLELVPRFVEPAEFQEGPTEGHAGGDIGRVPLQSGFAGGDGVFELACPPVLLRQGRERDRRRVQLDPASQFLDAGVVRHVLRNPRPGGPDPRGRSVSPATQRSVVGTFTATGLLTTARRPRSSVTVKVT